MLYRSHLLPDISSSPEEHQMPLLTTLMVVKICEARNLKNFHLVLAKFAVLRVHPNGGESFLLVCYVVGLVSYEIFAGNRSLVRGVSIFE